MITGSRETLDREYVFHLLDREFPKDCVMINGMAKRGVDRFAYMWALTNKVKVIPRYADWKKYPRVAGFMRNQTMVDEANYCIAIWDGYSSGTEDAIKRAKAKGLEVEIHLL